MRTLGLLLLALICLPLQAEEVRYITGVIRFPLREGPDGNSKFITGVPSGAKVTILEATEGSEFAKVRTDDGKEGYMESRRLVTEPPPKCAAAEADPRLTKMPADQAAAQIAALQEELSKLKEEHAKKMTEADAEHRELENLRRTSSAAVQTASERDLLHKKVDELSREKLALEQRYLTANSGTQQRWFLIGGGVLLVGVFLGILLPSLRSSRRQKSSYLSGF